MDSNAEPAKAKRHPAITEAARIKLRLFRRGLSCSDIDRIHGLPRGSAWDALRNPNVRGERAIAAVLGTRPHLLWRSRYHSSGQRKSQQDYRRPPTMRQRRNVEAI